MLDALQAIYNWLTGGIYTFFTSAFQSLMEWLLVSALQYMLWAINFGWGIAQGIISDLQISQHLNAALGGFPPQVAGLLLYFKIPEVMLNITSAYITRFVLRFIPGV